MTNRSLLRVVFLAALFLAFSRPGASCVQFDGQHVRVHVDAERDRLDLQIVYRDLHATESNLTGAIDQLDKLRAGERWFTFLSNWPLGVHLEVQLANPPEAGSADAALLAALDKNLEVRPGELWIDDRGRLCASQLVRIQGLGALLAAVNESLLEDLSDPGVQDVFYDAIGITDRASRVLFGAAVRRRASLLERRGAAFAFTIPVTDTGFVQAARRFFGVLVDADAESTRRPSGSDSARTELDRTFELLAANPFTLERRRDRVSLVLGDPDAEWSFVAPPTALVQPASLTAALTEAGWTIHGPEHEPRVEAAFTAFVSEP